VQIAFHFVSDGGSAVAPNAGWFMDDVALVTGTPVFNNPEGFESGLGDWSVDRGTWQVGVPTSGPRAAFSGNNCASLAVTRGDYQANVDSRLISPPLAVPAANQSPRLRFWHWYSIGGGDHATVEIKPQYSSTWTTLSADYGDIGNLNNVCGGGGVWTRPSLDLSQFAGLSVQIAFHFVSDGGSAVAPNAGWFMDDVALVTGTPVFNNPEGFESGLGDWSVDRGTWQVGVPTSGPGAAFSGNNCASLAVSGGDYQANVDSRLISPPLAVPAANQSPRLRFWHWYSIGGGDHATVDIKPLSSSTWTTLSADYGDIGNLNNVNNSGGVWTRPSFDLSQFAGLPVQIAFHFISDGGSAVAPNAGWFVDNIELRSGPEIFDNPETFGLGWGDWSTDNDRLWQIGVPTFGPPKNSFGLRAYAGTNVAATILNGNYTDGVSSRLISPSFTVPSVDPSSAVVLRFWQWYQYGTGDAGLVQIAPVASPTNWTTLTVAATNGTSTIWTQVVVDLTAYQGQQVRLGFYHTANSDGSVGAGWYLDNVGFSSFVPTPLTLGQPFTNFFTANGQYQYFILQAPPGGHLLVNLNALGSTGANELYLSRGRLPTPGSYDYRFPVNGAANQTIFAPNAGAGPWYVLAYNAAGSVPETYTLTAQFLTGIFLTSVTPTLIGNSVASSITINGAGFTPNDSVALINGGNFFPATNVFVVSASQIIADFNFSAIPPANYQLTVSSGTNSPSLPFTVIQGVGAKLVTQLHVPSHIGYHQPATIYVEYSNAGDAPMPAPLLTVSANQNGRQAAIMTLNSAIFVQGFWTASLPQGFANSVQFLASGNTPGLLQPGESETVPVYYAGWQQPWDFSYPLIYFHLGILAATNTGLVDWQSFKASMIPTTTPTEAWDAIFANFTNRVGNTWGGYIQALDDNATQLAKLGENITDIPDLLSFIVQQASGLTVVHTLAGAVDAQMVVPGPALLFRRTFTTDLSDHYRLGRLGRAWFDNWDITLTVTNDTPTSQPGTVTILGPGSSCRVFQPDSRNAASYFTALQGDTGILTSLGGGAYLLTEANGSQTAFRSDGKLNYVADTHGTRITAPYSDNQLTQLTHAAGPYLQFTYNSSGRIASVTDSFGRAKRFTYDASGEHVLSAINYRGEQTSYSYSIGLGAPSQHALTQVVNPDQTTLNYSYDSNGRLATRSGCCGAIEQVNYTYDNLGTVTTTDAQTNVTKTYFDYLGLVVRTQDPLGNVSQRVYDASGNLLQTTDPAGRIRTYAYDSNGNRVNDSDQLGYTTRYAYTATFKKLSTLIDAKGNVTSYAYNPNGDLVASTYADGSIERWGYDALGNRLSWINRRGQPILYTNDAMGRVISKWYPDGSLVSFNYDSRENMTNYIDGTGVTMKQLDTNDRPVQITFPGGQWLQYTYYPGGQRASMTDQLGHRLNYYYDARGRLQTLTDENGSNVVLYAYDAVGRLATKTLGNGIFTTYGYDAAGHTLDVFNHHADGSTLSRFQYSYDIRGRRTTMTTTYGVGNPRTGIAGMWTYNYGDDGQLIGWTAPNGRTVIYSYDVLGNRTLVTSSGTNTSYNVNNLNQYTQVGSMTLHYDADGNLTNMVSGSSATNFIWTADNRLSEILASGLNWTNYYDALGNRTRIIANGLPKDRVIDQTGFGNLVGEYAHGMGTVLGRYDFGDGLIARKNATGESDFYIFDALGSVNELVGFSGAISNAYAYLPFGELLFGSESSVNVFQFVGESSVVADPSGFSQMHAREYDQNTGRFLSVDPLRLAGGDVNLSRYVGSNPVDRIDPAGLLTQQDCYTVCQMQCYATHPDGDISSCMAECVLDHCVPDLPPGPGPHPGPGPNPHPGCASDGGPCMTDPEGMECHCCNFPNDPRCGGGSQPSGPQDPNSLIGPMGYSAANYVTTNILLPYSIQFENVTNATAPAQTSSISSQLTNALDWSTFQLTEIAFGKYFFAIPGGSQHYANTLHLTQNGFNFDVQVDVGLNPATGLLQATFKSTNPTNGLPPPVNVGFLPPETSPATGVGTGHISYTIRPQSGLVTGTQIRNVASVAFDLNPPIATDLIDESNVNSGHDTNKQALVTIDASLPTSSVNLLPTTATNTAFTVSWSGSDTGSGIATYDVYVQTNAGPWALWLAGTTTTSATFYGQYGTTYGFYSIAHDGAGNTQPIPSSANMTTTTLSNYPPVVAPVTNQFATVGGQLVITNQAYDPNGVTFSLGTAAPAGASVTTNGVFSWTPACSQGSTTNLITIWVTDYGSPPMSNSITFIVTVPECIQASIGNTVMQIGQTSSVPVLLLSTTALTNMAFTVPFPPDRLTNFAITVNSAQVLTQSMQLLDSAHVQVSFALPASSVLHGPTNVGLLSFAALTNQSSAFVPLAIINVSGHKPDGGLAASAYGQAGQVVIIGKEPLLEAALGTNDQRLLTLYGNPGASYQMAYSTNLLTTNWVPVWQGTMTNLSEVFQADHTPSQLFYRAWEF
jgi:RHS repeat-associated protein